MTEITAAVTGLITNIGAVVTALFGETGAFSALLPYFVIGIAASIILFAVLGIKRLVWGA